jgi:hypothetical protein
LDEAERGQLAGQPAGELLVDGRPALARLTPSGLEWSAASRGGGAPAAPPACLPFTDMIGVRRVDARSRGLLCCLRRRPRHLLEVLTFRRGAVRRCEWAPRCLVLEAAQQEAAHEWAAAIAAGIEAVSAARPK